MADGLNLADVIETLEALTKAPGIDEFDRGARAARLDALDMLRPLAASPPAREEAPADDGPVFHMNLLSHEDNEAWLASARKQAPAEGAGEVEVLLARLDAAEGRDEGTAIYEDAADFIRKHWPALRNRTSEPAREAWRLRANHKIVADTMQEMQNEIERLTGARHSLYDGAIGIACQFVRDDLSDYTHPAHATADKLRDILKQYPTIRLHAALDKLATLNEQPQ